MKNLGQLIVFSAALGISVFGLAAPGNAEDCTEHIGWLPYGGARAVAVFGDFAIFGRGTDLVVADVSNPTSPQQIGAVELSLSRGDRVMGIAVSGDHAYVAANESGLRVIDISTPASPIEIGFFEIPSSGPNPGLAYGVAVSGSYVYVAALDEGLRVIDISTPASPFQVGSFEVPAGSLYPKGAAFGVTLSHGYAYVAALDQGVRVVDVSTPGNPIEVGFAALRDDAVSSAVSGDVIYAAGFESGLEIVSPMSCPGYVPAPPIPRRVSGRRTP